MNIAKGRPYLGHGRRCGLMSLEWKKKKEAKIQGGWQTWRFYSFGRICVCEFSPALKPPLLNILHYTATLSRFSFLF